MVSEKNTILVTGTTGKQGGAVADHLLKNGWKVRAFTRDPSQKAAMKLKKRGAEIVQGDFNDYDSLLEAMEGVYGVFSVQDFWSAGYDGEVTQGKQIADAAIEQDVQHVVYNSAGGADRNTGVPHFDSKRKIELYIAEQDLPYTIFRPVFFMETFTWEQILNEIKEGSLSMGLAPDNKLQMIAVYDIGYFVAFAFENPGMFLGKSIEIAGDELTPLQITEQISDRFGNDIEYNPVPIEELNKVSEEMAIMFKWFNKEEFQADIDRLRKWNPELKTFEDWLKKINF